MIQIVTAAPEDYAWLAQQTHHLTSERLLEKVQAGEILLARIEGSIVGWLRWGYFWDSIPFMNHLFVLEHSRRMDIGTVLVTVWEDQMRQAGFQSVMTSSLSDEQAQHFYRKLGYVDRGALLLPDEALEIIFVKEL